MRNCVLGFITAALLLAGHSAIADDNKPTGEDVASAKNLIRERERDFRGANTDLAALDAASALGHAIYDWQRKTALSKGGEPADERLVVLHAKHRYWLDRLTLARTETAAKHFLGELAGINKLIDEYWKSQGKK